MGLDITAGSFSFRAGSYSGFDDFRRWIAKHEGLSWDLDLSETDPKKCKTWDLLTHSDCDGKISYTKSLRLLKGLNAIREKIANTPLPTNPEEYDEEIWQRTLLDKWRVACGEAIIIKQPIWFH